MRNFFLWLLMAPFLASAQNILDSRTANVLPLWNKGDRFIYEVKKVKQKYENASLDASEEAQFKLTFTVRDTTGGRFLVEQRMTDLKMLSKQQAEALSPEERALAERMVAPLLDVPVVYSCTLEGTELQLENMEEVMNMTRSALQALTTSIADEEDRQAFDAVMEALITPESIATSALEHAENLHTLLGGGYTVGERLQQDIELPNLLGGDPIPGKLDLVMNTLDQRTGKGTYTMNVRVDAAKLSLLAEDLVNKMAQAMGNEGNMDAKAKKELSDALRSMRITDTVNTTVDLNVAVVTTLTYKREVVMKGRRNTDSIEYRLVK